MAWQACASQQVLCMHLVALCRAGQPACTRLGSALKRGCAHCLPLLGHMGPFIWLALHKLALRGGAQPVAVEVMPWLGCPIVFHI